MARFTIFLCDEYGKERRRFSYDGILPKKQALELLNTYGAQKDFVSVIYNKTGHEFFSTEY